MKENTKEDRRIQKTRNAILNTFYDIVHRKPYRSIKISEIIEQADIARSTFYEHFNNKEDLLFQSIRGPLDIFARNGARSLRPDEITDFISVISHFKDNKVRSKLLFSGDMLFRLNRLLSK